MKAKPPLSIVQIDKALARGYCPPFMWDAVLTIRRCLGIWELHESLNFLHELERTIRREMQMKRARKRGAA